MAKIKCLTLLMFLLSFLIYSCSSGDDKMPKGNPVTTSKSEEIKQPEIIIPKYEIIEKMEHISMKMNKEKGYYFGSILLRVEDIPSKNDFVKIAIKIAIEENIGQASFYTDRICFKMNDGKMKWQDSKISSCYLGGLDVAKKGQNWKQNISATELKGHNYFWNKRK